MRIQQSGFASPITLLFTALFLTLFGVASYRVYRTNFSSSDSSVAMEENTEVIKYEPFTFTAASDFSSSANAELVLEGISESGSDFTVIPGDLGYGGNGTEKEWCDFAKSRVGENYPFQIVAGNHDDGSKDGDIAEYIKCLPDRLGTAVGDYGTEYYFDYNNLARFIMITPDIDNYGYSYLKNTENYDWVASTIDNAREQGLRWVVLGMHKNCISSGTKSCEIGEDLLNLAIEKKVDLVLQGHEHGYFRSKQLGFNNECASIVTNEVNTNCIMGEGGQFNSGDGTIIAIVGVGGYKLRDVNPGDSEAGYFDAWNGANIGKSYGFSMFEVTSNSLSAEFVSVGSGQFTDNFSINYTN